MSDNIPKRFTAKLGTSANESAGLRSQLEQIIAGGIMSEYTPRSRFDLVELLVAHFGERVDIARTPVDDLPRLPLKGWRVVDEVAVESELYLLLRSTTRPKTGVLSLTEREREAVRLACGGASNKEIAYLMNVSASTVGVLLWRASRRIGAADRDELTRCFEGHAP
jgi:DNA-binding CsgD family transcriptional regulator